eukprot:6516426-Prymnesium_polylepis.1
MTKGLRKRALNSTGSAAMTAWWQRFFLLRSQSSSAALPSTPCAGTPAGRLGRLVHPAGLAIAELGEKGVREAPPELISINIALGVPLKRQQSVWRKSARFGPFTRSDCRHTFARVGRLVNFLNF